MQGGVLKIWFKNPIKRLSILTFKHTYDNKIQCHFLGYVPIDIELKTFDIKELKIFVFLKFWFIYFLKENKLIKQK